VLSTGARLHIDRHESAGDKVRVYMGDSVAELAAAKIARFEDDGYIAPPAISAPSPVAAAPSPAPAAAPSVLSPTDLADRAADKYGLPHWLVRSVMKAESGFQPLAVSPKGAIGLMQLMPARATCAICSKNTMAPCGTP
jgi:soluble lytic murein transglycosylase-like protein